MASEESNREQWIFANCFAMCTSMVFIQLNVVTNGARALVDIYRMTWGSERGIASAFNGLIWQQ